MNEKKYLISIAIGPVQDFIASARRSRDLWFGSWLLSELSKVVAEKILKLKGELIFPANLDGNAVNKILAIIDKPEIDFDGNLRRAINDKLKDIYNPIFDKIEASLPKGNKIFYRNKAENQIKDLTELYWAAVPFDENNQTIDENGKTEYERKREQVEILLNARKATRDFQPVTWGSDAPKSSLDGERESVILDREIDKPIVQRVFNLRNAERLCGVGVLKRLTEKKQIASTSHMASLPLLETLLDKTETRQAVKDYIGELKNQIFQFKDSDLGKVPDYLHHPVFDNYDGHLLFENRIKDLPFENKENEKEAKKALLGVPERNGNDKKEGFLEKAFGKIIKPNPYFALLQADGDRMGTVIDNQKTKDDHKNLSEALSKFANDVKAIIENHKGSLIYAGGDDVLAMLPLHTVLDCTRHLSVWFKWKLRRFKSDDKKSPTLSAGIAIVHHTEPLQESLETMRRAEKEAKSVKGKNAPAIILSKRSGADTTIKGNWGDDRKTGKSFDERLKWFIQLHLDEALPDGVAYELRDLWLRFQDENGKVLFKFENLLKDETLRILKRKKSEDGVKEIDKTIFNNFEEMLKKVAFSDSGLIKADWTLEDLANEIIVARDFKRAYKQAGITKII